MMKKPHSIWFTSSAGHGIDVDVASHEPSHIHIARPSRLRRRDTSGARVDPTAEVRDLADAEATEPAA